MHIIVEGPNLTGKSWLARELSRHFCMPVVNRMPPRHSVYAECVGFLATSATPMVIDRLHVSEAVYGPMKRGKSRLSPREYRLVELLCILLGTANVHCTGSVESIVGRHRAEPERETFVLEHEVPVEVVRFDQEVARSLLDWEEYRIGDDIGALAKRLARRGGPRQTAQQARALAELFLSREEPS